MKIPTWKQHVNMALVPGKIIEDYKEYQSENAALREALKELIPIAEERMSDLGMLYHNMDQGSMKEALLNHGTEIQNSIEKAKTILK